MDKDDSVRIFRTPSFLQYTKAVVDFSRRRIRDPWRILDAFEGLQSVFGSECLMNTPFLHGMPLALMDTALLWQPRESMHRLESKINDQGEIVRQSPPSWT